LGKHELSYTELKLILEGIEITNIRRRKRFSLDAFLSCSIPQFRYASKTIFFFVTQLPNPVRQEQEGAPCALLFFSATSGITVNKPTITSWWKIHHESARGGGDWPMPDVAPKRQHCIGLFTITAKSWSGAGRNYFKSDTARCGEKCTMRLIRI
jgi:hypothetical protein